MQATRFQTLTRHILDSEKDYPDATGELSSLLTQIALAAKVISFQVNKAGLSDILGFTGGDNVHGEQVKKLDIYAHEVLVKAMDHTGHLCVLASEEEEDLIHIPKPHRIGKYVVVFDPLDGSSNIDVNVSIGSIFSIYRRISSDDGPGKLEDVLQPGDQQVAAGYIVYGSSTIFVYTAGKGTHGFTLDPTIGEFLLSHENITIPKKASMYSINEGNYKYWHQGLKNYIQYVQDADDRRGWPYKARYIGSLVADIHRNMIYGGIFIYPEDKRSPNGKLRLLYECNPIAFLVEQAGGLAFDGTGKRIMELQPESIHQRVPIYVGSEEAVNTCMRFLKVN